MAENQPTELALDERCWLLIGTSLYDVIIAEACHYFEGEPDTFTMYRVKSREHSTFFEDKSQHRSDLFRNPDERAALMSRIDYDRESLDDLLRELERERDEAEDAAPSPVETMRAHLDTFGED